MVYGIGYVGVKYSIKYILTLLYHHYWYNYRDSWVNLRKIWIVIKMSYIDISLINSNNICMHRFYTPPKMRKNALSNCHNCHAPLAIEYRWARQLISLSESNDISIRANWCLWASRKAATDVSNPVRCGTDGWSGHCRVQRVRVDCRWLPPRRA